MGAITESNIDIDFAGGAAAPPPELDLRPEHLEFGRVTAPLWFRAWYRNGAWERGRVEPWHTIDLHPAAIVLQSVTDNRAGVMTSLTSYSFDQTSQLASFAYPNAVRSSGR